MKFKLRAFGWHLLISLIVASIVGGFVFLFWYPNPLAKAVGVSDIFWLMLGVDVALGPLLTLLVAKQGKKTLKMDLMIIGLVQLGALIYGVYNISMTRPLYIVYDSTRFELVQANQLFVDNAKTHWGKPQMKAVKPPKDDNEKIQRVNQELESGYTPASRTELYQEISISYSDIARYKYALNTLNDYNDINDVKRILSQYPKATGFYPLKTTNLDMVVLVDDLGQVISIVDLRPW